MSSRGIASKMGGVALRVIVGAGVLASTGCAYFNPAFITNASPLRAAAATTGERGVMVCQRRSITRSECDVVPQSEVNRFLAEMSRHQ